MRYGKSGGEKKTEAFLYEFENGDIGRYRTEHLLESGYTPRGIAALVTILRLMNIYQGIHALRYWHYQGRIYVNYLTNWLGPRLSDPDEFDIINTIAKANADYLVQSSKGIEELRFDLYNYLIPFHPDIMFKVIETSSGYQIWMYHD